MLWQNITHPSTFHKFKEILLFSFFFWYLWLLNVSDYLVLMTFEYNWPLAFPEFCWTWTAVRDKTFSLYDSAGMTRFVCNVYNCNRIPTDVIDQPRCYNCEHFCNLYVMINEILLAIIIVTKFGFKICIQITWHPSPPPFLPFPSNAIQHLT